MIWWFACADEPAGFAVVDRVAGVRAPLTAACDDIDPVRCLLPWPSNTFARVDPTTETGLRVAVEASSLAVPEDDVTWLNVADGFSRVTGVVTAMPVDADPLAVSLDDPSWSLNADAALQVLVAQPDHPRFGERVAFRGELREVLGRYLLIGRPAEVLPANADHVVVATDAIGVVARSRSVELALDLVEPASQAEAALVGYHAPTRALLDAAGVDIDHVVRVWDFTTRSAGDPTVRLHAMMDALASATPTLGVVIDAWTTSLDPAIAGIALGRLTGTPAFLDDNGLLATGADGLPAITGTRDVPLRIVIPAGAGDYRVALYGHGTGGDINDSSFDEDLAAHGIAKLNMRFDGWTGEDLIVTLVELTTLLRGSALSTHELLQALAGGTVLVTALDGVLGDAVSADTIGGVANPAAGRRPLPDGVVWVGGSQGGTMGAVMIGADPRLRTGVLNVPGGGWTHMIPYSLLYGSGMEGMLLEVYDDPLDLHHAMVMAQNNWDEVDGAVWADEALAAGGTFLLQESMGDPILPNLSTELLAAALGAIQFEPALSPIFGLERTTGTVTSGAAIEQFRVPDTGQYDVHGFAALDTLAADAAFDQIQRLLDSAWAGHPEIVHAALCDVTGPEGACDFTGMW